MAVQSALLLPPTHAASVPAGQMYLRMVTWSIFGPCCESTLRVGVGWAGTALLEEVT